MKTMTKRAFALAGVLALGFTAVHAQQNTALLDALVKKGVLSDKEAEDIQASEAKEYSETPASKLSIADHITKLKLYGDARFRFEYADEKPQSGLPGGVSGAGQGDNIVERNRYRLRVGVDYTFTDNLSAGFGLESNTANDSYNQTMGNAYGKSAINIGLIYLQWKPVDWLTLTGGKQRNPLYTTDLTWDPDINPEGGSEVISFTLPLGGGSSSTHDPKDLKSIVSAKPSDSGPSLTIGLTAFQGIYADNQEFNASPAAVGGSLNNATDVWQFVEQVPVQFNFNKDTFIKVVPGFDSYMSGGNVGSSFAAGTFAGGGTQSFSGPNVADHLQIFTAPGEVDWKSFNMPFKLYWDFALNTDGEARVQKVLLGNGQVGITQNTATLNENRALGDNVAWMVGVQVGKNKKKGDWSVRGDFRQVGLGSIDPNLNDSDWGDSFLNQQGIKIQSSYNFTDFLVGSVSYYDTWAYKNDLLNGTAGQKPGGLPLSGPPAASGYSIAGGTAGLSGLVAANNTQKVQVDLSWKF